MNRNDLYNAFNDVDDDILERSETASGSRKNAMWLKWGAIAACLCLVVGAVTLIPRFGENQANPQLGENQADPQPGGIVLSEKTTAKVSYGYDAGLAAFTEDQLVYLTEDEMFAREDMYVFRGKVSGLTNVTIDFNGEKESRCIATIVIEKVYQGDLWEGDQITMLIPCAIDLGNIWVEDTDVITQLESGMEGIFMPWAYDENSYIEMNGAVLMKQDLAACGLADGMRWVFLDTDHGLLFERGAYPGAEDATDLDDIEAYVTEMLK